ncbi:CLC_0170 family protein [Caldicellulosiruptoraceae bacterium PP1]
MNKVIDLLKDYSNVVFILSGIFILLADCGELKKKKLQKELKAATILGITYIVIGLVISFI